MPTEPGAFLFQTMGNLGTHELCHLKEHNHSQVFYKLLSAAMKDWELRRKRLNEMVEVRFV